MDFQRTLQIDGAPADVFDALTTETGLKGWWSATCRAEPRLGSYVTVRFGRTFKVLRVDHFEAGQRLTWRCVACHVEADVPLARDDEWIGTDIDWVLTAGERGSCELCIRHRGLTPALSCYQLCSDGWDHFLASLTAYVTTGTGNPNLAGQPCNGGSQ